MKKLALLTIVVLFSVSAIVIAQKKPVSTSGDHPFMNAAKKKLNEAEVQLKKATHDYAGHRIKAIQLIEDAIKEIDLGLAADNK